MLLHYIIMQKYAFKIPYKYVIFKLIKVFLEILSILKKNLYFGYFILISLFSNLFKCSRNKKDCCVCALNIFNINLTYNFKIYNIKQRIHNQRVILTQTHSLRSSFSMKVGIMCIHICTKTTQSRTRLWQTLMGVSLLEVRQVVE